MSTETDVLRDTGERFIPGAGGAQIAYEHLHRYLMGATFCTGRRVLDIGSGEGYGSFLLARAAAEVVGIDREAAAIIHARRLYPRANLRFVEGSALDLAAVGLADGSFDVAVCFEMIEHVEEQEALLAGIRTALKPDGLLIISSPNRLLYSDRVGYRNPFHVRELYFDEFRTLLDAHFAHAKLFAQNIIAGSAIWPLRPSAPAPTLDVGVDFDPERRMFRPMPPADREALYFIAVASNAPLDARLPPEFAGGSHLYDGALRLRQEFAEEVERLDQYCRTQAQAIAEKDRGLAAAAVQLSNAATEFSALATERATVAAALEHEHRVAAAGQHENERLSREADRLREAQATLERQVETLRHEHANQAAVIAGQAESLRLILGSRGWRFLERLWWVKGKLDRAASRIRRLMASAPRSGAVSSGVTGARISIVIPAFNHGRYLRRCIESALHQLPEPHEIVIVDDCSTDPQARAVLEWAEAQTGVVLLRNQTRAGISRTLNRGILASTGEFVGLLDCDDILLDGALAAMQQSIRTDPAADFHFSDRVHIDSEGREIARVVYGGFQRLLAETEAHAANLMCSMVASHLKVIRRTALDRVGLFSPDASGCQDYDLALRLTEQCLARYVPAFLYAHRWHAESVTLSRSKDQHVLSQWVWQRARRRRYLLTATRHPGGEGDGTVVFIVQYLVVGGAERVLEHLVTGLAVGRKVGVICTDEAGDWYDRFAAIPNCRVASVAEHRHDPERHVREIIALVDAWRASMVHISNSAAGYRASAALCSRYPRPWIVDTLHSDQSGCIGLSERHRAHLDHRIVVSRATAQALVTKTEESPERISVVYNGVVPEATPTANPSRGPTVVFVGRLSAEKCPLDFVEMAAIVGRRCPAVRFRMVGGGPEQAAVSTTVSARGLGQQIELVGEVSDARPELAAADIVVLSSRTEGTPMVLLEAMAAGRAVVATAVGGVPEVIEDGVCGLLAPPAAPAALAECVVRLIDEPTLRETLGAAARARVTATFSAARMVEETTQVYARSARGLMGDGRPKLVSIVILSWNRPRALERCLASIRQHTRLPYEVVLLDNGSSDARTLELCAEAETRSDTTVVFEPQNLGCSAGRCRAFRAARGDYIVSLDNDIEVQPQWLEHLVLRLEEDPTIGGACCRLIWPDGIVEFSGGMLEIEGVFARFLLRHHGLHASALETLEESDCGWIPGGASIFRRAAIESAEHCELYSGPYEDNDYSLQLTARGFRLVNCPLATVLHHHRNLMDVEERRDQHQYLAGRQDPERLRQSLRLFYRRNGLVIRDPGAYGLLGLDGLDDAGILRWFDAPDVAAERPEAHLARRGDGAFAG